MYVDAFSSALGMFMHTYAQRRDKSEQQTLFLV